jgi:hypothetical protein
MYDLQEFSKCGFLGTSISSEVVDSTTPQGMRQFAVSVLFNPTLGLQEM